MKNVLLALVLGVFLISCGDDDTAEFAEISVQNSSGTVMQSVTLTSDTGTLNFGDIGSFETTDPQILSVFASGTLSARVDGETLTVGVDGAGEQGASTIILSLNCQNTDCSLGALIN